MKLVVGLGNPGNKYKHNRHNVGFMLVDLLVARLSAAELSNKFDSVMFKTNNVILMKPQTYMNLSGKAVLGVSNFFKISKENILVAHDDLDLDLCKIKVKVGGGSGGNNGINSIDQYLGADYKRLRIGIGRPEHKSEVANYVLSDFTEGESKEVMKTLSILCDNMSLLLSGDDASFLNRVALDKNK